MIPILADANSPTRARRGILVAGMGAMAVAAVAAGAFVITRDGGDATTEDPGTEDVVAEDVEEEATELATDTSVESTAGYSFAAATSSAQDAASVVFDMDLATSDGPMSATASFDRTSGRLAMDLDLSQLALDDEFFDFGDSLSFIVDEQDRTAYVGAEFFAALFGPTDAEWVSVQNDELSMDDDVFGDVFSNPLNIADVFGDVEPIDVGDETIAGEVLRHFEVTLDEDAVAELGADGMLTRDPTSLASATYDVWVDESSQIRRILLDGGGEAGGVDMWITISNDPIDIALPDPDDTIHMDEFLDSSFEIEGLDPQDSDTEDFDTEED